MSVKQKWEETGVIFFVTFTCFKWLPLFEKVDLYDNIYNWFGIINEKGVRLCGFVILPNHIHLLLYLPTKSDQLHKIISNGKRFFAYEIVKRLRNRGDFSTLKVLQNGVRVNEGNKGKIHQVFEHSFDAKLCITEEVILQKLNYIHANPVSKKWNLAKNFLEYPHSSAMYYEEGLEHKDCMITHYKDSYE
ncbi:hypothetical protein SAMN06298216_3162 [Spirosomataceae bacterium TFI 002]|nr:hypothetical protein SAMN06298216_3162 [Spirosomataceae bacterium TFI 002]